VKVATQKLHVPSLVERRSSQGFARCSQLTRLANALTENNRVLAGKGEYWQSSATYLEENALQWRFKEPKKLLGRRECGKHRFVAKTAAVSMIAIQCGRWKSAPQNGTVN
jgi:hypothetical protein